MGTWGRTVFAAAALAGFASPAMADSITLDASNIGDSYSFTFDGYSSGTTISGLTASATFTLTGISGNDYTFDYAISNTSSDPVTGSRVSGFAFNADPDILSAASTGDFAYTTLDKTYPNGIGTVDVCFKDAATGSCAGGAGGGLTIGETGTGTFTLSFSQPISSLTLSDFYTRYQSIYDGNLVGGSASGTGSLTSSSSSSGGTPVPEPGMLGILGLGLVATAMLRRRRMQVRYTRAGTPAFA